LMERDHVQIVHQEIEVCRRQRA